MTDLYTLAAVLDLRGLHACPSCLLNNVNEQLTQRQLKCARMPEAILLTEEQGKALMKGPGKYLEGIVGDFPTHLFGYPVWRAAE